MTETAYEANGDKRHDPEETKEEIALRLFSGHGQKNRGWVIAYQQASRDMRKHLADHLRYLGEADREALQQILQKEHLVLMSVFDTVTEDPPAFSFPSQHNW